MTDTTRCPKICLFGDLRVELEPGEIVRATRSLIWTDIALAAFAGGEKARVGDYETWGATRKRIHHAQELLNRLGLRLKCSGISTDSPRRAAGVYVYFEPRVATDCDEFMQLVAAGSFGDSEVLSSFKLGLCTQLREAPRPQWVAEKERKLGLFVSKLSANPEAKRSLAALSLAEHSNETCGLESIPYAGTTPHTPNADRSEPLEAQRTGSSNRRPGSKTAKWPTFMTATIILLIFGMASHVFSILSGHGARLAEDVSPPAKKYPYMAQFVSASGFEPGTTSVNTRDPNEIVRCEVDVANVGTEPWQRGYRPISLGVVNGNPPTDKNRAGIGPMRLAWCDSDSFPFNADNKDRVYLGTSEVIKPGQIKRFVFGIKVPSEPGPYAVTFQMVMDGPNIAAVPSNTGWFAGPTMTACFQVRDNPLWIQNNLVCQLGGSFSSPRAREFAVVQDSPGGAQFSVFKILGTTADTAVVPETPISLPGWQRDSMKVVSGDFDGDGLSDIAILYKLVNGGHAGIKLFIMRGSLKGLQPPVDSGVDISAWNWEEAKVAAGHFGYSPIGADDLAVFRKLGKTNTDLQILPGDKSGFAPIRAASVDLGTWTWEAINPIVGHFSGTKYSDIGVLYEIGSPGLRLWLFRGSARGLGTPVIPWSDMRLRWESIKPAVVKSQHNAAKDDLVLVQKPEDVPRPSLRLLHLSERQSGGLRLSIYRNLDGWDWDATMPVFESLAPPDSEASLLLCTKKLPLPTLRNVFSIAPQEDGKSPVELWHGTSG